MKKLIQKMFNCLEHQANRHPFLHGAFIGGFIILGGAFFLWPDKPQYQEVKVTANLTMGEVFPDSPANIGSLCFTILHDTGYILIKTSRFELIKEIEERLDDPETRNIRLMRVTEGHHSMWGPPGWRLSVESEFIKTYPHPKPCLNRELPI